MIIIVKLSNDYHSEILKNKTENLETCKIFFLLVSVFPVTKLWTLTFN